MKLKALILISSFLLTGQLTFSQQGKLFLIKEKDTLSVVDNGIKVFLEVSDQLITFNQGDNLVYPQNINLDSINAIIVLYNKDTLRFYDLKEMTKSSKLPLSIVKASLPIYSSLFSDKRNMYFTIDSYPFENKDRKQTAIVNVKDSKEPLSKMTIIEFYYQVKEMHVYHPKKGNYR
jgi:hypothetical protein